MTSHQETRRRRSIRLKEYDYSREGAYFVTICTHNRECIWGDIVEGQMHLNDLGREVEIQWLQTAEVRPNVILDAFVIMPNHFHGIFFIQDTLRATQRVAPTKKPRPSGPISGSVGAIVAQFKSRVTKRLNVLRKKPGVPVWQRNYYEHVIRDEDDLNRIREYIDYNHVSWMEDENYPGNL